MIDLYLKSDTADEMSAALAAAGFIDEEGQPLPDVDIDRIGEISRVIGYDENDEPIIQRHKGYHANVRTGAELEGKAMEAIAPLVVDPPATPSRVWG